MMHKPLYVSVFTLLVLLIQVNTLLGNASESKSFPLKTGIQYNAYIRPGVVGMDIFVRHNQYPIVQQVLAGLRASRLKSGLLKGDQILEINHISALGKTSDEIDRLISDEPGTTVNFRIQRGNEVLNYNVTVLPLDKLSRRIRHHYQVASTE